MVNWKVLLYKLIMIKTKAKRAFDSRRLFNNWLEVLIKYALIRVGFNIKLVARVSNCAFELSREVFERFVSRFSRGLFKSIECVNGRLLVNGVEVDGIDDLIKFRNSDSTSTALHAYVMSSLG